MKSFKIHFSFILVSLCFIFSPYQAYYFKLLLCLLLHELGHLFFVYLFNIKIFSLKLYAFGFLMNIDNKNTKFIKNIFIYSGGIIFNLIFILIFKKEYLNISYMIILLNLFPIYPLDGYMILKNIISYIFPYKITLIIINVISLITIALLFVLLIPKFDWMLLFNFFYLIYINFKELKSIKLQYQSFMLHRFLNINNYKIRNIKFRYNNYDFLYRYHKINTLVGDLIISEKEILKTKYRQ